MHIVRRTTVTPAPQRDWNSFVHAHDRMHWEESSHQMTPVAHPQPVLVPDIDIRETPEAYMVYADLPGAKEKDLEITLAGNRVTISGNREETKREAHDKYVSCERFHGSFSRSFTLPIGADADHAKAKLEDGVLTLTIPKNIDAQAKKIQVHSAKE